MNEQAIESGLKRQQCQLGIEPDLQHWPANPSTTLATGHQAWHWHPGILAKYIAQDRWAKHHNARTLQVVVDHDLYDPLRIEVPWVHDQQLHSKVIYLGKHVAHLPPMMGPAIHAEQVLNKLKKALQPEQGKPAFDPEPLLQAWQEADEDQNLATQLAGVLDRLMHWLVGVTPAEKIYASQLVDDASLQQLLKDPWRSAASYNAAVQAYPQAGMSLWHVGHDLVELPLWALTQRGRQRVFAQRVDQHEWQLVQPDNTLHLVPRAALLTALMRSQHADLFIHGQGGGIYDQITEQWWQTSQSTPLAPKAVVSADVYLDLPLPQATPQAYEKAVWWAHHLPFNLDRHVKDARDAATQKQALLEKMQQAESLKEKRTLFDAIHQLNAQLAEAHSTSLADAQQAVQEARLGMENQRWLQKRDWCFAFYSQDALQGLVDAFESELASVVTMSS